MSPEGNYRKVDGEVSEDDGGGVKVMDQDAIIFTRLVTMGEIFPRSINLPKRTLIDNRYVRRHESYIPVPA